MAIGLNCCRCCFSFFSHLSICLSASPHLSIFPLCVKLLFVCCSVLSGIEEARFTCSDHHFFYETYSPVIWKCNTSHTSHISHILNLWYYILVGLHHQDSHTHTAAESSFEPFVFMLIFNLWLLNQSLMAHLYNAISQHHCLFLSAMRHKLALCSNFCVSKVFSVIVTGYNVTIAAVLGVCVGWEEMHVLASECQDGGNILMNDASWWVCWGWQINKTPSAVGLHAHSLTGLIVLLLSFFQKPCHSAIFMHCFYSSGQLYMQYWGLQVRWL